MLSVSSGLFASFTTYSSGLKELFTLRMARLSKKKWRIPNVPSLAFITIILLLFLLLICTGIFPSNFYITFQVLSVTVNFIFNQASGKTKVDKREV